MAQPTHALQCEHGAHPRYCAICRARVLALHGQPVRTTRRTPPSRLDHPMPPWFREAAARSIAEAHAAANPPKQDALDLEDS